MPMERQFPILIVPNENNFRDKLLSKAFLVVPGIDYNRVSYELRERNSDVRFQFYEVVLDDTKTWNYLEDIVYPSLVRHLRYKSIDPVLAAEGVVVSLFFDGNFYLIGYRDFIKVYCEMERLDEKNFRVQVIVWLSDASHQDKDAEVHA